MDEASTTAVDPNQSCVVRWGTSDAQAVHVLEAAYRRL